MVPDEPIDRHPSVGVNEQGKDLASPPPTDQQSAPSNFLTSSPLALHRTTTSVAQEVTIRQVAPLVIILTGATFLNVKVHQLPIKLRLTPADYIRAVGCYYFASNQQRSKYSRDTATMDCLSVLLDVGCIPTVVREAG